MWKEALKRLSWIYGYVLRSRMTGVGRDLHRLAREKQVQVACGPRGIRLRCGSGDIWFRNRDAALAWAALTNLGSFQKKLRFMPKRGRPVADCRGRQLYVLPGIDDLVELPMPPEPADIVSGYFMKGAPREGDVAFDVGAFCGELTVLMARRVGPRGRVIAFEPDLANSAWLKRNVARLGLANVTVVESGLWGQTTTLRFASNRGWLSALDVSGTAAHAVTVPVLSFEDACGQAGCVPDFVKMDIEGAEWETLDAARSFIRDKRIRFSVASYHAYRDGGTTSAVLEPLFREAGYRAETGFPDHLTTWAWRE